MIGRVCVNGIRTANVVGRCAGAGDCRFQPLENLFVSSPGPGSPRSAPVGAASPDRDSRRSRRHFVRHCRGRGRRPARSEWGRQNHHPQDVDRTAAPHRRHDFGAGVRAVSARCLLPAAYRPGDGAKIHALVGCSRHGNHVAPQGDVRHRRCHVRGLGRRTGDDAGPPRPLASAGPQALAGRTDEDGVDGGIAASPRRALSRRTDDWAGCGGQGPRSRLPGRCQSHPRHHDHHHQPRHGRHRSPLRTGDDHRPRESWLGWPSGRPRPRGATPQAGPCGLRRTTGPGPVAPHGRDGRAD